MLFNILKTILLVLVLLYIAPPMIDSIKRSYNRYISPKTHVAVIPMKQELSDSHDYTKYLHEYFKDDTIKAILLTIDCSGGAAGTSQALFHEIISLKKEYPKPIITLVENSCTSGAYYIACATDHIIASGTALIGGIGATLPYLFEVKDCLENFKIHHVPLKAGAYKTVGNPFTQMSSQEKELMQGVLDDSYRQFATDVAHQRNLTMNTLAQWADGKLFSGNQAYQLGLIDALGSTYTAINTIKEKALIEGEIEWIKPPESSSWLAALTDHDRSTLFSQVGNYVCTALQESRLQTH